MVADEVQSGMGRTGKMFAMEQWGVVPDIVSIAKGIASGLPLGAIVAPTRIMGVWTSGAHANTFGGNPVACAAANVTIRLLEESLMANATAVGAHIMERAGAWPFCAA
jgi:4-aminobutyrate aminotransferase